MGMSAGAQLVTHSHTHTFLTIDHDIHEVGFRPQRGRRKFSGTAVSNKLEWLINDK